MKTKMKYILCLAFFVAGAGISEAKTIENHGRINAGVAIIHEQDSLSHEQDSLAAGHIGSEMQTGTTAATQNGEKEKIFMPLKDFPNLHPMVVHFPIVLLLVAFFTQLIGMFVYRQQLSWVTMILLAGGFLGAILASKVFHVHAADVSPYVHEIFETHESLASITLWLSGVALLFKIISHFLLKSKKWAEWIVFAIITGAAATVTLTGHLGSEMVYIENIGPQGNHTTHHHDE